MKKVLFILLCLLSVGCLKAQRTDSNLIDKFGDVYFLGSKQMTEAEYLSFIQQNCREAWHSYQKGAKLWRTGWWLAGSGLTSMTIGTVNLAVSVNADDNWEVFYGIGASFLAIGIGLVDGAVPCLVVGGIKKNRSHHVYNETCSSKPMAVTFSVGATQNGFGLAMNF